jgi:hypothetical protein
MTHWDGSWLAAILLVTACGAARAAANDPPADVCSLLPAARIGKIIGQAYNEPQKTVAPRPYANTAEGTNCAYKKVGGSGQIVLIVYADPSPSEAATLFAKLGVFYSPQTPVAGLSDKAYFDRNHGLHVLKGRVRFFISMDNFDEKQAKALAAYVVGRL